jgi:hypothetical protein
METGLSAVPRAHANVAGRMRDRAARAQPQEPSGREGTVRFRYDRRYIMRAAAWLIGIAFVAGGCTALERAANASGGSGAGRNEGSVVVAQTPAAAVRLAATVFRAYQIPVSTVTNDAAHSGTFRVQGLWGGVPIERRVTCSRTEPDMATIGEVELQVSAYAIGELVPPNGLDRATPRSTLRLAADGRTIDNMPGTTCRLTGAFVNELLNAIANAGN